MPVRIFVSMARSSGSAGPLSATSGALNNQEIARADLGQYLLGHPPAWVRDEAWKARCQVLDTFPFQPSILELCAGAGTASLALKLLLGMDKVRLAGAWDTDTELRGIHALIHGGGPAARKVHLGRQEGDILAADLASFPDASIVVAGPPCPPFSTCGKRMAMDDPRSRPFERCVEVIVEVDKRASHPHRGQPPHRDELMFFMLENVLGIEFTSSRHPIGQTPLDILLRSLRSMLGTAWIVQPVHANAVDYGLPQNRPRIYIVGRKAKFYTQYIPAAPRPFRSRVRPADLLDLSDTRPSVLTALQQ